MEDFVSLYQALSETSSSSAKVENLIRYFREAPAADLGWAIHILRGEKLRRPVSSRQLREWASEVSGYPLWLIEESYHVVGDLAETIAKVVSGGVARRPVCLSDWIRQSQALKGMGLDEQRDTVRSIWRANTEDENLVFNKLITGGLRIGVSRGLVTRALAVVTEIDEAAITQRLLALREPGQITLQALQEVEGATQAATPYPFYLAYPIEGGVEALGDPAEWIAEWKWDGIRGQIVRRGDSLGVWSRGEELVTESFPELRGLAQDLPEGTVIDGEIVSLEGQVPGSFAQLQKRLNRSRVPQKLLSSHPVGFVAYDLLELGREDLRARPCAERRKLLEEVVSSVRLSCPGVLLSDALGFSSWREADALRSSARKVGAEGLMLKRRASRYGVGRRRGDWWKWKLDPLSVDGVLVYAQKGHGRRAGLFTDYTFAVWRDGELVPFAKAYSGLSDAEIRQVDEFVKSHTKERFGPVRTVEPLLVFEIGFEGIQGSTRHKSGVAVRFPRILRWRRDKPAREADSLEALRTLVS
jgi:DNA ligase-1